MTQFSCLLLRFYGVLFKIMFFLTLNSLTICYYCGFCFLFLIALFININEGKENKSFLTEWAKLWDSLPVTNSSGTLDIFDVSSVNTRDINESVDKSNIEQAQTACLTIGR